MRKKETEETAARVGLKMAERVREALVAAALAGWEEAGVAGLCGEGAFEAAVGRMRSLELEPLVAGGEPAAIIGR